MVSKKSPTFLGELYQKMNSLRGGVRVDKSKAFEEKIQKHQVFYELKYKRYKAMDIADPRLLNRLARLMNINKMIMRLYMQRCYSHIG